MTADSARARMPIGTDRRIKLWTRSAPLVGTIVDHTPAGVYLGVHPHLCFVPYADIESAR